jgi:transposase-like protein
MRDSKEEKQEIIRIVEQSEICVNRTIKELNIIKATFYNWHKKFLEGGPDALEDQNVILLDCPSRERGCYV